MESVDFYKNPGEDVLINSFDCHYAEELALLEALSTGGNLLYLQKYPIDGNFENEKYEGKFCERYYRYIDSL